MFLNHFLAHLFPGSELVPCDSRARATTGAKRAYRLARKIPSEESQLEFTLDASPTSPLVNPAFVIKGWGDRAMELIVDDKAVAPGPDFRTGFVPRADATDATVWIRMEASRRVSMRLNAR